MRIDDYAIGYQGNDEAVCSVCGSDMDLVRPGKWQCQKCELDEMLQQASREVKAEGIRLGWEQCKREAGAIALAYEQKVYESVGDPRVGNFTGRIARLLASMTYNEAQDESERQTKTCPVCLQSFSRPVQISDTVWSKRTYCSRVCGYKSRRQPNAPMRNTSRRVDLTETPFYAHSERSSNGE